PDLEPVIPAVEVHDLRSVVEVVEVEPAFGRRVLLELLDASDQVRVLRPPAEVLPAEQADRGHADLWIGIGVAVGGAVLTLDGVQKVADLGHRVPRHTQAGEVTALERLQAPAGNGSVAGLTGAITIAADRMLGLDEEIEG